MKKLLLLFLCLLLTLAGCEALPQENDSLPESSVEESKDLSEEESSFTESVDDSSADISQEVSEESSLPEASEPDTEPRQDIFELITDHGKEIQAYGDLNSEEYADIYNDLEAILEEYDNEISFVIISADNSKGISYNTESRMFCASAIKAGVCFYACMDMEEKNTPLSTQVEYKSEHYEPGTGNLQYEPVGSVFDLETTIREAMRISDNVGYLITADYFGRENYNLWAEEKGIESLKISPTVWSLKSGARDFAFLWKEIYNYFGTNSEYAKFLYNSCTNTEGNFATKVLGDVSYSHKQGHNRSGGWHSYSDAGIVWDEESPYIFAILSDIPGPNATGESMMADIMAVVNLLF